MTIYPKLTPNVDIILFLGIILTYFSIVLNGRVILEELNLSIPLSGRAIFHSTLFDTKD